MIRFERPGLNPKWRGVAVALCMAVAMSATAAQAWQTGPSIELVSDRIQERIADKEETGMVCRGEPVCGIRYMPQLYEERRFEPVWLDAEGLRPTAQALIRTIAQAGREGLRPADYHLDAIRSALADLQSDAAADALDRPSHWADIDVLLTDAFLLLCSHLSGGRVNPETLHRDWVVSEKTVDIMTVLHTAVTEAQIDQVIDRLSPSHAGYADMRTSLHNLAAVDAKGGWPGIPEGPTLRPGDRDMRVLMLRDRLKIGGDLTGQAFFGAPEHFDATLAAAVQRFQSRHGLDPDGAVGPQTLAELNVSARERLRQIELNLERWRWLPHDLGRKHIAVNTADFSLQAVEDQQVVLHLRVVVGRPARRTPVFSASMASMVLNPYWTIPPTIAIEDVLPQLLQDVGYLERHGIKVYYGWDENAAPLDPRYIDWRAYGKNSFPFRLVQAPGPNNALGRIKFLFPNRFSVYLHDTPNRALFAKLKRDFSSGCIRVEDAPALAGYLLRGDPDWPSGRLQTAFSNGRRLVIRIKEPMPVHLLYMTAWVDEKGVLQFRRDIYGRDTDLDRALKQRAPSLSPAVEAILPEAAHLVR